MARRLLLKCALCVIVLIGLGSLTGCWSVEHITCDTTEYHISEAGAPKRVYAMEIREHLSVLPWSSPINGWEPIVLLETMEPPKWGLHQKLRSLPPWRHMNELGLMAYALGPAETVAGKDEKALVRWVISTNPLVVGVGVDQVKVRDWLWSSVFKGRLEMLKTFALAGESNLDRMVTELVVLDTWPERTRDSDLAILQAYARAHARNIRLAKPATLRELLESRPWEKRP